MMMMAAAKGQLPRALMIVGEERDGHPLARHWYSGMEEEFDPELVLLQLERGADCKAKGES